MKTPILCLLALAASIAAPAQPRRESVTPEVLRTLEKRFAETPADRALQLRLQASDLLQAALDSSLVARTDTSCTYRVPTSGITDQRKSGRCWLFSTLNILRAEMIARYDMEAFEFSQTYGQFWDILEKSNHFLENVIANRRRPIDSRMNEWLFKKPIGDGSHFTNAAHLIAKYGLVPQEAMPEVHNSMDNARLMRTVTTLLHRYGLRLRDARRSEFDAVKTEALGDICRLLSLTLGTPPRSFTWTLRDRTGRALSTETYTPESFRDRYAGHDMERDYAVLMNDPTRPYFRMYEVDGSRNCRELGNWCFLNLPMETLREIAVGSLRGGRMFYFSCDTTHDALPDAGIYDTVLYDVESLLGIPFGMSREELFRSNETRSVHAMAMAGVALDDAGHPAKWVAENSFGADCGTDGYVTLSDEWFARYLFRMVVERRFLQDSLQDCLSRKPVRIPAWNPNY